MWPRPPISNGSMPEATKAFGQVDILVNNAGVSRSGAFETLTDERTQEDLDQETFRRDPVDPVGMAAG